MYTLRVVVHRSGALRNYPWAVPALSVQPDIVPAEKTIAREAKAVRLRISLAGPGAVARRSLSIWASISRRRCSPR